MQNGVKAQAGASSAQRLAPPWPVEATAVEVVRPLQSVEEGLRPVVEAAKREVRQEVVAAGVVGRLERIMRILPVIQEAALASRDLARQASGETAAALGVSTKVNAEVVGLKRQLATSLDTLGRNLQTDVSEEVRKGAEHVASSIRTDLDEMEGRISKKVATSSEVLALQQRLDSIARLVEDLTRTTAPLQAIPRQVDALQQQLSQRTLDPADLDLQRSELGGLSHVSQQLQGLRGLAEENAQGLEVFARGIESVERVADWGAEVVATCRNLEGSQSDVRDAAERTVQLSEEVKEQVAGLSSQQESANGQMERVLAEGLAKIVAQLPGILERGPKLERDEFEVVGSDNVEEVDVELLEARSAYLSVFTPSGPETSTEKRGAASSIAVIDTKCDAETVSSDSKGLQETEHSTGTGFLEDEASVNELWANPLLTAVASQQSVFPGGARLEVPRDVEEATEALFAAVEEKLRSGLAADEAFVRAIDEAPPGMMTDASWAFSIGGDETGGSKLLGSNGESARRDTAGLAAFAELAEAVQDLDSNGAPNGLGNREGVPEALEQTPSLPTESGFASELGGATRESEGDGVERSSDLELAGYPVDFQDQKAPVGANGEAERRGRLEEMSWGSDGEPAPGDQQAEVAGRPEPNESAFGGGRNVGAAVERRLQDGHSQGADVGHDERWEERTGVEDFWERPESGPLKRELNSAIPAVRNGRSGEDVEEVFPSRPAPGLFYSGEPGWDPRVSSTGLPDLRGSQQLELELSPERSAQFPDLRGRQQLELERESWQGGRELLTSAGSVDDVILEGAESDGRRELGLNAALGSDRGDGYGDDWGERRPRNGYSQRGREGETAGVNRQSEQGWDYDGESDRDGFESGRGRRDRERRSGWQERRNVNRPQADYEEDLWDEGRADSPRRNRQPVDDDWEDDFETSPQPGPTYSEEDLEGQPGWEEPLEVPAPPTRQQQQYEESVARGMRLLEEGRKGLSGQSEVVVADRMFSDAQAAFEDALAVDPDDRWALLQLGSAFVDHGEMKLRLAARVAASAEGRFASPDEEEWLQAILDNDVDPADVIAELRAGSEELLKEAGAACRDALARDPRDEDALTLWGLALCFRGLLASDRGTEEGSGDLRKEADDLFRAGIEKYEAAHAENPNLWTALLNWGFALRDRSRLRPITSVQRRKLLIEALDLVAEVAESGKKGGAETLMARQELPVLENELETVEEAVQSAQSGRSQRPKRLTSTGGESPRRGGNNRWQDL